MVINPNGWGSCDVIFHLWGKNQVVPDGTVTTPTSIGHVYRKK